MQQERTADLANAQPDPDEAGIARMSAAAISD